MKCIICKKEIEKSYYSNAILCSQECHTKNFWQEYVSTKNNPYHIVIEGQHYVVGKEETIGFKGFNGKTFVILKNNKNLIVTTNLWCQGEIPLEFREKLPNNGMFLPWIWSEIVRDKNKAIIIDNTLYVTGQEDIVEKFKANKGQKFKILKDKEIIISTNLRNWGEVPQGLKEDYPNNAQFL